MIDKTFIERRVYNGAPVKRGYKVTGMTLTKCEDESKIAELVEVDNMIDYSAGCSIHRGGCFGHMCVTPTGNILPPQSLSFRSGDIRTQYYIAATKAFDGRNKEYIEKLKETNYGKHGHLRSIMSTPVSGSSRLVCAPHTYSDPRVLFMSENLASKILFCLPEENENGVRGSRYVERSLREGDYMILERAPSLSEFNNQPVILRYWDKECVGVHPKVFSFFHGDFDGDESHGYAIGDPDSIEEAKAWIMPLDDKLTAGSRFMLENFSSEYTGEDTEGDIEFLKYTTASFNEIQNCEYAITLGKYSRTKPEHLEMFRERLNSKPGTKTFLERARKGVRDIIRQQVHQGKIGDMSRVSRIAATCFVRGERGGTYVVSRRSKVLINNTLPPSAGCPAMRCIMVLCQASQEAAFHAHRVGSVEQFGIDLISSLLKGRLDTNDGSPCNTVFILRNVDPEYVKGSLKTSWCFDTGHGIVAIAADNAGDREVLEKVKGAYSPVVLSRIPAPLRKSVCRKGINMVFNYYGLRPRDGDLDDLVEMFCYRVQNSTMPITTRDGIFSRGLGWMETLIACDYTKLPALIGSTSGPFTATSASMCSNFSGLY